MFKSAELLTRLFTLEDIDSKWLYELMLMATENLGVEK